MNSRSRCRWADGWVAALLATAAAATPAAAAADPRQVQQAIDHGRDYLFRTEKDGNWEAAQKRDATDIDAPYQAYSVTNGQWGGMTAIATLALLSAGVSPDDPHVRSAVAFLRSADLKGNYALGMRAAVWNQLPAEPWLHAAELSDGDRLVRAMHTAAGPSAGFYGYLAASKPAEFDHSVSQFAVLGVWSLAQAGCEVPVNYWRYVDAAWHHQQAAGGTWAYYAGTNTGDDPTLSMTAAGVATLYLAQEYNRLAPQCRGNVTDAGIDAGLRYLGDHLTSLGQDRRFYTLFGISRVGLASGYKRLGPTDWFAWGADLAVHDQRPDGSWHNQRENENVDGVADTAFALLFLSRGRAPLMMDKLQYDVTAVGGTAGPGPWDQRPRDVANLARWVGRQIESPLNWQVVTLRDPSGDLHDAPVLYLAGGEAPRLSPADVAKLRAYCEDGGLILGHADCGSEPFARGFERLGEQMFPGRRFRPLEPTSPVYTDQTFPPDRWPVKPPVRALTNGTRELMVLLPAGDPARQWQSQSFLPVKKDVYGQLLIDLFLYAVDKQGLRRRGETYVVDGRADVAASTPVKVARLQYAGNWDPEPGGWRRLANVLHNDRVAELDVRPVDPAVPGQLAAGGFKLAVLTVADADARLTDAARSAVRDYITGGGTLLVDAAGGRGPYRSAAEAELAKLFPDDAHALAVLPPDAPVYAALAGNPDLALGPSVEYRHFGRPSATLHRPQLRGLAVGGRPAVFYSPEDVSVGLVGQPIGGVAGYAPADATKVVAAVVAYAAK